MRCYRTVCGLAFYATLCAAAFADVVSLSASKDETLYEDTDPTSQLSDGQGIFIYVGKTGSNFYRRRDSDGSPILDFRGPRGVWTRRSQFIFRIS
jgi:hypothetical protein